MTEFQRRLEANIRESLRFAVGEVQDDAVAHMVAGVNAVLDHPSAPAPEKHVAGIEEGIERAARYIEKQRDDYVQEFGMYDPSTGVTEFSTAGEEHLSTLEELIDGIRSLQETPTPPGNQIRTAECDGKDAVPVTGQLPVGTVSTQSHVRVWTQKDAEREYVEFAEWFKERGYPGYPDLYPLTTENAMHSAWQEAAKRAALATTEGTTDGK